MIGQDNVYKADHDTRLRVQLVYLGGADKTGWEVGEVKRGGGAANKGCIVKRAAMVSNWNLILQENSGKWCKALSSELSQTKVEGAGVFFFFNF